MVVGDQNIWNDSEIRLNQTGCGHAGCSLLTGATEFNDSYAGELFELFNIFDLEKRD